MTQNLLERLERKAATLPRIKRVYFVSALVLVSAYLVFSTWASISIIPWLAVANHPIQLSLSAPAKTEIELCWKKGEPCLPLIPDEKSLAENLNDPNEKTASLWLGELPPDIDYHIEIRFPNGLENGRFESFLVINTNELRARSHETTSVALRVTSLNDESQVTTSGLTRPIDDSNNKAEDNSYGINLEPGGKIEFLGKVTSFTRISFGPVQIFLALLAPLVLLGGIVTCTVKTKEILLPTPKAERMQWFWIGAISGGLIHLLLAQSGTFFYNPSADSRVYLGQAYSLYANGTLDTQNMSAWLSLVRTPGYSALLALWMQLVGPNNFSVLMLLQALMVIGSLIALGFTLRGRAPGWLLGVGVFLALLLPHNVWGSLALSSDGPYAAFIFYALACWFERLHHPLPGRNRWMWLYLFFTCCAIAIRPTGIILLAPLLLRSFGCIYLWRIGGSSIARQEFKTQVVVLAIVLAVICSWSLRNLIKYHYIGVTSYTDMVILAGEIENGTFDLRSIRYPAIYRTYVQGRYNVSYAQYHVQITGPLSSVIGSDHPNRLNAALRDIWTESSRVVPLAVRFVGVLRNVWFETYVPAVNNHGGARIIGVFNSMAPDKPDRYVQRVIKGIHGIVPDAVYDIRGKSPLWNVYLPATHILSVADDSRDYQPLWLVAFLIGAIIFLTYLYRGDAENAALFLVYSANLTLLCFVGLIFDRYVLILFPLIIFQIVCAISMRKPL